MQNTPQRIIAVLFNHFNGETIRQEINLISEKCTDPHVAILRQVNQWIDNYGNEKTGGLLDCIGYDLA